MNWKRVGRTLLCLLVVCCLVINMSPIRAEATVVGATVGAGIFATLFSMAMGAVFVDLTAELVGRLGDSMSDYMIQWGTSAEKLDEVESFLSGLELSDDIKYTGSWSIPSAILSGLISWGMDLINGDIAIECKSYAADGFLFYSDMEVPDLSAIASSSDQIFLLQNLNTGSYFCLVGDFYYAIAIPDVKNGLFQVKFNSYKYYSCLVGNSEWKLSTQGSATALNVLTSHRFISNFSFSVLNGDFFYSGVDLSEGAVYAVSTVEPSIYVGDIPTKVQDGTFDEESYELPYINYGTLFQDETSTDYVTALNNVADQLAAQTLTYEAYMDLIEAETVSDTETDSDIGVITGTFADTAVGTFLAGLINALMTPFEWLVDKLLSGIQSIFVPSEDFLSEKVDALRSEFGFADSIIGTFEMFGDSLFSVDTSPPIIYIDLSQSEGSYYLGDEVVFVDLTWYEKYKPTVDILLSAFMWLCFFWRVGRKLPDIIRGASGDVPDTLETGLTVQR